jgi:hypothetical protein
LSKATGSVEKDNKKSLLIGEACGMVFTSKGINPERKNQNMNLPSHAVRSRRFFYGPTSDKIGIAFLGTLAECKKFIADDDATIYHTSHNESGRWLLRIVRTNTLSQSAIWDAERRMEIQSWDNA